MAGWTRARCGGGVGGGKVSQRRGGGLAGGCRGGDLNVAAPEAPSIADEYMDSRNDEVAASLLTGSPSEGGFACSSVTPPSASSFFSSDSPGSLSPWPAL